MREPTRTLVCGMDKRHTMDLTDGPVFKKLIIFVIPIVLSGVLQQLYNSADSVVVGQFVGDNALAAVGSTVALTNLILNLFVGLAVGANVICARCFGAGDKEALHRAIHSGIAIALTAGIVLAIIGNLLSEPMLRLMGTPDTVIDQATLYMQVCFLGSPFSMVYNFGAGILRAGGDTKRPLYILTVSGLVNVALNLFCVLVLHLGVLGVAIGTISSQLLSCLCVLRLLMRSKTEFHFELKSLRFYKKESLSIIKVGLPAGLNGIMFSFSNVILQSTVNTYGDAAMAGVAAAGNIEIFMFIFLSSVEQGVVSFTAQNMGAGKLKRIDLVLRDSIIVGLIGVGILNLLILPFQEPLLRIFTDGATAIYYGKIKIFMICAYYFLYVPSMLCGGSLRGMGWSITPAVINVVCICLARILWVYTAYPLNMTMKMLFYAYPVSWGLSMIAQGIAYMIVRRKMRNIQHREPLPS